MKCFTRCLVAFKRSKVRWATWVFFAPVLLFSSNLDGTWILDDHYQIEENPYVRSVKHIPRIWTTRVWESTSLESTGSDIYRPVFLTSYILDSYLFALAPWACHLLNNLLHALNALLLFLIMSHFVPLRWAGWAAIIFALHPLVVEGVTWISGRMDLLVTFFALLNLLFLRRALCPPSSSSWKYVLLFFITIPLGLFSKEVFLPLPFLFIGSLWLTTKTKPKRLFPSLIFGTFFLTLIGLIWRNQIVQKDIFQLLSLTNLRNANALLGRFFTLFLNPSDSDFFFQYPNRPFSWSFDFSIFLGLLIVVGVLVYKSRKNVFALWGWGLLLGPFLPLSLIVDLLGLISERYFYLPFAGFCILLAQGSFWAQENIRPRLSAFPARGFTSIGLVWILALSTITVLRNREWRSEVQLYESSMERDHANYLPHFFMAWHHRRTGRSDLEVQSYQETLKRKPGNLHSLNNLAVHYIDHSQFTKALPLLERALKKNPHRAKTFYNFGYFYERQGQYHHAKSQYEAALHLRPGYLAAQKALRRIRIILKKADDQKKSETSQAVDLE